MTSLFQSRGAESTAEPTRQRTTLRDRAYAQRRRVAILLAVLLTAAVAYHVVFGKNGLTAFGQKQQETRALETEMRTLQHENEALKGHVDRLASDPDAIERQAREELHYTRPGEVIVTLPPDPPAPTPLRH